MQTADAIHLAAAVHWGCDALLTNDRIPDEAKSLTMRTPVARWPHCLRGGSPSVASSREGPAPAAPLNGTNIR
jgi:hypothetical protein